MFEFGVLLAIVIGGLWLFGALLGGLFKLTFWLIGMAFGGLLGVLVLAVVALALLPLLLFAVLPALLPVLCIALVVWLVVHASRTHADPAPVQGDAPVG